MTTTQLEILLDLYKRAVTGTLSEIDIDSHVKRAKIDLDQSFVQNGKEDQTIKRLIEELDELQKHAV